jgi:small subunit ribosomal protein S5
MSVSRPVRCLFLAPSNPLIRPRIRRQNFYSSPKLCERRRPKTKSISAAVIAARAEKNFPKYTKEEEEELRTKYTPAQMKAIAAGERSIDTNDLETRGVFREDIGALPYFDDLSATQPTIDKKLHYHGPIGSGLRRMTSVEQEQHGVPELLNLPKLPKDIDWDDNSPENVKRLESYARGLRHAHLPVVQASGWIDSTGPLPVEAGNDYVAPGLPKYFMQKKNTDGGILAKKKKKPIEEDDDPRDPDGQYNKLIKKTGMTLDDIFQLQTKVLVRHRVVNQTRLGKIDSTYCLAIAGNGDGQLGIGESKGQEPEDTVVNARIKAIQNMKPIPRYENRTIYGDVKGKVSAVEVALMNRPPGFGLRCQHLIFEMAKAAGLHDLAARVPRSRNKMNTCKATYQALMKQRIPSEIAMGLGKKLIDVRKVYYGGRV